MCSVRRPDSGPRSGPGRLGHGHVCDMASVAVGAGAEPRAEPEISQEIEKAKKGFPKSEERFGYFVRYVG